MQWAVAVSSVLVAACAAVRTPPAVPPLPSQGGPAWIAIESEHFTVWSDAAEPQGRRLLAAMERLREVIYGTSMFGGSASAARIVVVAFRNAEEVGEYLPKEFAAYATGAGALFQPVVVIDANAIDEHPQVLAHELAHAISFGVISDQPPWFAEALAGYYETVQLSGSTRVVVGKPLADRVATLGRLHPRPMADVFACTSNSCMDARFYATTWALFLFLATEHEAALSAYMTALYHATPATRDAAFVSSFPQFADPSALDHALAQWIARDRLLVREYRIEHALTSTGPARSLDDAGALVARGVARFAWVRTTMPDELVAALAIDPTNVPARMIESQVRQGGDPALMRAVAEAHAENWRAWWLLEYALYQEHVDREAQATAYATMCKLVRSNPDGAVIPPAFCPDPD